MDTALCSHQNQSRPLTRSKYLITRGLSCAPVLFDFDFRNLDMGDCDPVVVNAWSKV